LCMTDVDFSLLNTVFIERTEFSPTIFLNKKVHHQFTDP